MLQMLTKGDTDRFYNDLERLQLKFPVATISKMTGFAKGNVSDYIKRKKEPSENFLKKFYEEFSTALNVANSVVNEAEPNSYMDQRRALKQQAKKRIPFYEAEASGGIVETEMTPISAPAGTIDIGDLLHDSQAAIRIYGNSMLPNYPPGCVVGLTKCDSSFIEPGEVYVIETRDRRILKRLFYPDDKSGGESLMCYSDNIMKYEGGSRHGKLAYPPYEIPKKEIINLFVVTGVIKRNANSVIINR